MKDFLANLLFYLNIYTATETTRKDGVCKTGLLSICFTVKCFLERQPRYVLLYCYDGIDHLTELGPRRKACHAELHLVMRRGTIIPNQMKPTNNPKQKRVQTTRPRQ